MHTQRDEHCIGCHAIPSYLSFNWKKDQKLETENRAFRTHPLQYQGSSRVHGNVRLVLWLIIFVRVSPGETQYIRQTVTDHNSSQDEKSASCNSSRVVTATFLRNAIICWVHFPAGLLRCLLKWCVSTSRNVWIKSQTLRRKVFVTPWRA